MGASYSNPLVDSALVFPAPPSSYSEDTPGLLRLRSKFMPGTDVPAFLIRPRVRATTSSRFLSDRATGGGTGSNTVCRSGGTDPSLFSAHYSHVPHQVQSSTSPCLHSASSPSSYPCVSPNSLRGVRASVRVSCPRARTPSRLQPPFLCPASSRITPRRGSGGFSRVPDTSCLGSRFFPSTACHSLPREAYSSNLARGETATRIHPAHGALGGDGGFSGEVKGFPGQRKSCTAGTEAQSAARSTRGGLFLRKEERGECCATAHGDHAYALTPCGSGSSFLGPKSEGETLTSEGSGGRSFLSQEERKRTDKGFCMLYFHGNACDANMMRGWLQLLADELKVTILIFEYPGYGLLEDYDKSSRGIDLCARVAFEFLVEKLLFPIERIILCGRSIGTGAAAWLAAHLAQRNVQVGGLVLIAPFVSLAAVAADWADAPLVLTRVLVHHHWNSEAAVAQIPLVPLCIIHGKEDDVIPVEHAKRLWAAARQPPSLRVARFADSDHNVGLTLESLQADIVVPLQAFLQRVSANLRLKHAAEKKPVSGLRQRASTDVQNFGVPHRNLISLSHQPWTGQFHGRIPTVLGSPPARGHSSEDGHFSVHQGQCLPSPQLLPHQGGQVESVAPPPLSHTTEEGDDTTGEGGKRDDDAAAMCFDGTVESEVAREPRAATSSGTFLHSTRLSRESPQGDFGELAPVASRSPPVPAPHHIHLVSRRPSRRVGGGVPPCLPPSVLRYSRQRTGGENTSCTPASSNVHAASRESDHQGLDSQDGATCSASPSSGSSSLRPPMSPSPRDPVSLHSRKSLGGSGVRKRSGLGSEPREEAAFSPPEVDSLPSRKAALPQFLRGETPTDRSRSTGIGGLRLRSSSRLPYFFRFRTKGSAPLRGDREEAVADDQGGFLDSGNTGKCGVGERKQQVRPSRASSSSENLSRAEEDSQRSRRGSWAAGERRKFTVPRRFQGVSFRGSRETRPGQGESSKGKLSFLGNARGDAERTACDAVSGKTVSGLSRRARTLGGAIKMRLEDNGSAGRDREDPDGREEEVEEEEGDDGVDVVQDDGGESGPSLESEDCTTGGEGEARDSTVEYYSLDQLDPYGGGEALEFHDDDDDEEEELQDPYLPSEQACAPPSLSALLFEGADPAVDMPRRGEQQELLWGMPQASLLEDEDEAIQQQGEVDVNRPVIKEGIHEEEGDHHCSSRRATEVPSSSSTPGSPDQSHFSSPHLSCQLACTASPPFLGSVPTSRDGTTRRCSPTSPFFSDRSEHDALAAGRAFFAPDAQRYSTMLAAFLQQETSRALQQRHRTALQAASSSPSSHHPLFLRSFPSRALRVFKSSSVQQGSAFIAGSPLQSPSQCFAPQKSTQGPPREKATGPVSRCSSSSSSGGEGGRITGVTGGGGGIRVSHPTAQPPCIGAPSLLRQGEQTFRPTTSFKGGGCGSSSVDAERRVTSSSSCAGPQSATDSVKREVVGACRDSDVLGSCAGRRSRTVMARPAECTGVGQGKRQLFGRRKTYGSGVSLSFQKREDFLGVTRSRGGGMVDEVVGVRKLRPWQFQGLGDERRGPQEGGHLTELDTEDAELLNEDSKVGEQGEDCDAIVKDYDAGGTYGGGEEPRAQEGEEGQYGGVDCEGEEGQYEESDREEEPRYSVEVESPEHTTGDADNRTPSVSTPRSSVLTMDWRMDTSETCFSEAPGMSDRRAGEGSTRANRFMYRQSFLHEAAPSDSPPSAPSASFPLPVRCRSRSPCSSPPSALQSTSGHAPPRCHSENQSCSFTTESSHVPYGYRSHSEDAGEVFPCLSRSASSFFSPAKLLRNRPSLFRTYRSSHISRLYTSPRSCRLLDSSSAPFALHRYCSLPPRPVRGPLQKETRSGGDRGDGCAVQTAKRKTENVGGNGAGFPGSRVNHSSEDEMDLPSLLPSSSSFSAKRFPPPSIARHSFPRDPGHCSMRQRGEAATPSSGFRVPSVAESPCSYSSSCGMDSQTPRDSEPSVFVTNSLKLSRCAPTSFPVSPRPPDVGRTPFPACPSLLQASSYSPSRVTSGGPFLSSYESGAHKKAASNAQRHSSRQLPSPHAAPPLFCLSRYSTVPHPRTSAEPRDPQVTLPVETTCQSPRAAGAYHPSRTSSFPSAKPIARGGDYLSNGTAGMLGQCSGDTGWSSSLSPWSPSSVTAHGNRRGVHGLTSTSVTPPISVPVPEHVGADTSIHQGCFIPEALASSSCSPRGSLSPSSLLPHTNFPKSCSRSPPAPSPAACFNFSSAPVFPPDLKDLLVSPTQSSIQARDDGRVDLLPMRDLNACAVDDRTARRTVRAGSPSCQSSGAVKAPPSWVVPARHIPTDFPEGDGIKAKKMINSRQTEDLTSLPKRQTERQERPLEFSSTVQRTLGSSDRGDVRVRLGSRSPDDIRRPSNAGGVLWEGFVDEKEHWRERVHRAGQVAAQSEDTDEDAVSSLKVREECRLGRIQIDFAEKRACQQVRLCGFLNDLPEESKRYAQDRGISFSSNGDIRHTEKENKSTRTESNRSSPGHGGEHHELRRGGHVNLAEEGKGNGGRIDRFSGKPGHLDTNLRSDVIMGKATADKQVGERLPKESSCPMNTLNEPESSRDSSRTNATGGGSSSLSSVCDSVSSPVFHLSPACSSPHFPATAVVSSPSYSRCSSSSGRCSLPPPFLPPPPSVSSVAPPSFRLPHQEAYSAASYTPTSPSPRVSASRLPHPDRQGASPLSPLDQETEGNCGVGGHLREETSLKTRGEARPPAVWLSAPVVSPSPPALGDFHGLGWPLRPLAAVTRLRPAAKTNGRESEKGGESAREGLESDLKPMARDRDNDFSPGQSVSSTDEPQNRSGETSFPQSQTVKGEVQRGVVEEGEFSPGASANRPAPGSPHVRPGALQMKQEESVQNREVQVSQRPKVFRGDSVRSVDCLGPVTLQQPQQRSCRGDRSHNERTEAVAEAQATKTPKEETLRKDSQSGKRKTEPVHFIICSDDDVACPPPAESNRIMRHDGAELVLSCNAVSNCRREHSCCWGEGGTGCSRHRYQISHSDSAHLMTHTGAPCTVHPPPPIHSCSCCTPRCAWAWAGTCCRASSLVACPSSPPVCSSNASAKGVCRCSGGDTSCSSEASEAGRVPRSRGTKDHIGGGGAEYETCSSSSSSFSPCSFQSRSFLSLDPWSGCDNEYPATGKPQGMEGQETQNKDSNSNGVPAAQGGSTLGEDDLSSGGGGVPKGGACSTSSAKIDQTKSDRTRYSTSSSSSSSSIAQKRRVVRHGTIVSNGSRSQCSTQGPNSRGSSSRALSPNKKPSQKPSVFLSSSSPSASTTHSVSAAPTDKKADVFSAGLGEKGARHKNSPGGVGEARRGKNSVSESCASSTGQAVQLADRRRVSRHISFPPTSRDECSGIKGGAVENNSSSSSIIMTEQKRGEREGWVEGALSRVPTTGKGVSSRVPEQRGTPRRIPASSFF